MKITRVIRFLGRRFNRWLKSSSWHKSFTIESFLTNADSKLPVNLIGKHATYMKYYLGKKNARYRDSAYLKTLSNFSSNCAITPRSNTIICDPKLAYKLITSKSLLTQLGQNTYEWVLLPLPTKQLPMVCFYSNEFSYQEMWPTSDNGVRYWRWAVSNQPATVSVVNCGEAGEYTLSFTLSSVHPGNFTVRLGSTTQTYKASTDNLSHTFLFKQHFVKGAQRQPIIITFDGEPMVPENPLEVRKQLFYGFSDCQLLPANNMEVSRINLKLTNRTALLSDTTIREVAHESGFFEVSSIDAQTDRLSGMVGLRSCFDYITKFSLKDYKLATSALIANTWDNNNNEIVWYLLRRTPSPYSEF